MVGTAATGGTEPALCQTGRDPGGGSRPRWAPDLQPAQCTLALQHSPPGAGSGASSAPQWPALSSGGRREKRRPGGGQRGEGGVLSSLERRGAVTVKLIQLSE